VQKPHPALYSAIDDVFALYGVYQLYLQLLALSLSLHSSQSSFDDGLTYMMS